MNILNYYAHSLISSRSHFSLMYGVLFLFTLSTRLCFRPLWELDAGLDYFPHWFLWICFSVVNCQKKRKNPDCFCFLGPQSTSWDTWVGITLHIILESYCSSTLFKRCWIWSGLCLDSRMGSHVYGHMTYQCAVFRAFGDLLKKKSFSIFVAVALSIFSCVVSSSSRQWTVKKLKTTIIYAYCMCLQSKFLLAFYLYFIPWKT